MLKLGDVSQENNHVYVRKTKSRKLFHRSKFPIRESRREVKASKSKF